MKTKVVVLSVFAMFLFSGIFAQVVNIPDKAKDDFARKHANARDVEWDNKVTYYIVHYTEDGVAATAHYRLDGTWDFTENKIKDVPAEVKESFSKSKYRDWEVNETAFVENDNSQKMYRYEVTKGVDKKYVFFDKAGNLIKENPTL
jgi:hypothetical protein